MLRGGLRTGRHRLPPLSPAALHRRVRAARARRPAHRRRSPPRSRSAAGALARSRSAGSSPTLALHALADDLSATPPGTARVRVLAAAPRPARSTSALAGGPALARALPFGGGSGHRSTSGRRDRATSSGRAPRGPRPRSPGSVNTLLVLDAPGGGLTVRTVLDAAGPAVAPVGAVEAGGGGIGGVADRAACGRRRGSLVAAASRRGPDASPRRRGARGHLPAPPARSRCRTGAAAGPGAPPRSSARRVRCGPALACEVPAVGIDTALIAGSTSMPPGRWCRRPTSPSPAGSPPGPPRASVGPAVLAGHVDSVRRTGGLLPAAATSRAGDAVLVTRADGTTVRFTVTRVARYPEDGVPDRGGLRARRPGRAAADHLRRRLRPRRPQLRRRRRRLRATAPAERLSGGGRGRASRRCASAGARSAAESVSQGSRSESRGVGRPGDDVRRPEPDLLVAARAAVGLARGGAGQRADHPVAVRRLLDRARRRRAGSRPADRGAGPGACAGASVSGSRSPGSRGRSCGRGSRR